MFPRSLAKNMRSSLNLIWVNLTKGIVLMLIVQSMLGLTFVLDYFGC